MNTAAAVKILTVVMFAVAAVAAAAYLFLMRSKKRNELKVDLKHKKDFLYTAYILCSRVSALKKYMRKIRNRIELIDLSDDWTISRKTIRFTLISVGITLFVFVFLVIFSTNIYLMIISVFTVYILHKQILTAMVERIDNKLLKQFGSFLENVRHHYHEHGMIDEAIFDSIDECGYEISLHANLLYEVLTSANVEERVEQYNETAPNKYMKTFLSISYLVMRFGDRTADGKSIYLTNLNYLKQEINLELLRREKLSYLFQSLSAIAVLPIFALKPLEKWAISNIPELIEYYDGAYGFVCVIVLFVLAFGAYQLITKLQSSITYAPIDNSLFDFLLRLKFIRNAVEGMIERNFYKAAKYDRLLKKTGAEISVNRFYARQIGFAVIAFVLSLGVFINVHAIVRNNVLNSSISIKIANFNGQINTEEQIVITERDREYILNFSGKKASYGQIYEAVTASGEYTDSHQADIAAKRIFDKITVYNNHYLKWWELLVSIIISVIAYHLPWWMLLFRERILRMNMEDEVMQFHTIILMLMHIERIHVEDILFWMEQFAVIFKSSLSKCINNFEYGDKRALEQLTLDEPYIPFVRIVENLQTAVDKISISEAFDELKSEREYYQEKRKQDNEILVNKKGMWGKMIAFVPLGATVFLYMILPFILVSAAQLSNFSEEINKVF